MKQGWKRFQGHQGGNVSLMFGLAIVPIIAAGGAGIDYSALSNAKTKIASIADAAALAGASKVGKTFAEKKAIAEKEFNALVQNQGLAGQVFSSITEIKDGVRVEASITIKPMFMGLVGASAQTIKAAADAQLAIGNVEIALVLDNTGSMKDDMVGLRDAATSFTDTVFASGSNGTVKMSLVPYSASVNVGSTKLSMSQMDTGVNSQFHGRALRYRQAGYFQDCNWNPGGGGGGGGPSPDPGGSGKKGVSLQDPLKNFAEAARELLGIKPAYASAVVTPNTDLTTAVIKNESVDPPYAAKKTTVGVPNGWIHTWHPCGLYNPEKVSNFDMFNRIKGAKWKGCVEARPEPYDVTDEPPTAGKPDTLFVPYFWPDEPDKDPNWPDYVNNYLPDGPSPVGWSKWEWERFGSLFKYDGKQTASIKETAPDTSGPNKACGQELTPLTADKPTLMNEISKMNFWNGGGTISSEGLMWGWRTISPKGPLAVKGDAYDKVKKYIVLMSDGDNSMGEQHKWGPVMSEYGAYGFLRDGRFPSENYAQMDKYLSDRMDLACKNVKAAGITVVSVLFRVDDSSTKQRMRDCASGKNNAYEAKDAASLKKAFASISGDISKLRLTK